MWMCMWMRIDTCVAAQAAVAPSRFVSFSRGCRVVWGGVVWCRVGLGLAWSSFFAEPTVLLYWTVI